jgi:hypothetical protein|tara:strand:- start:443 stop:739 length:297 start_codon:yes stop_codon:yes gene_type:complete
MEKLKLKNYEKKPDRLMLRRAQEQDLSNSTSWVRLLEMELELKVSNGIMLQFFRDFEIYGLREAMLYLKGYEEQGEVPRGTFDSLQKAASKVYDGEKE